MYNRKPRNKNEECHLSNELLVNMPGSNLIQEVTQVSGLRSVWKYRDNYMTIYFVQHEKWPWPHFRPILRTVGMIRMGWFFFL